MMQAVTQQQFLEIANKLAQQQEEYYEGFIVEEINNKGGVLEIKCQGFSDGKGKIELKKFQLANIIASKIEPILRANYIVVG